MTKRALISVSLSLLATVPVAAGCGGGGSSTTPSGAPAATASSSQGSGALTAEAGSAAAGDIPDNQVFLTFRNGQAGYSMQYPEGWAQRGSGRAVTFQDKNNLVRVTVSSGAPPSLADVRRDLARLKAATPSFQAGAPETVTIGSTQAVKVVYTTESTPNSVTGKRVTLAVDRYYLSQGGRLAVVDLGTPKGVDNVDAYGQMIESFRWR